MDTHITRSGVSQMLKRLSIIALTVVAALSLYGLSSAGAVTLGETTLAGKGAAKGSWSVTTSNGTQFSLAGKSKDHKPGGNSIYWKAQTQGTSGTCFAPSNEYVSGSCSQDFYNYKSVNGTKFNSGEWRSSTKTSPLDPNSMGHRANLQACEDRQFLPDGCSDWSLSHKSYWMDRG